ncbi:hypothetical protein DFH06DRAFT_1339680 [Mycena polygramma]|nr:hypothetical protein DFH06DRAFT_1339680 [Mycena polygramma]
MSRTLWFFIGAGFGTWWATKKQWNVDCKIQQRSIAAPAVPSDQKPPMYNNTSEAGLVETTTYYQTPSYRDWEQERRQFTQHAEDTVVELSEATLSTILQATEALKAVRILRLLVFHL